MTIKKQLLGLGALIITIPVLCVVYIYIHNYLRSSDRLLIEGYKEIRTMDSEKFTEREWKKLDGFIKNLPPNSEFACIDHNFCVVFSNIDELELSSIMNKEDFVNILSVSSKKYFYQFTTIPLESNLIYFISRVPRVKQKTHLTPHFIPNLLIILFLIVTLCTIMIILIFININHSISILKNTTKNIADGDLSQKIKTKNIKKANEITEISTYLEKMRESLQEAQQQKYNFIMGISHDLRTPVSIIKGYSEALLDGVITDESEIQQAIELINGKSNQLEEMVDTLINLTKLNSLNIKQTLEPLSITAFIKDYTEQAVLSGTVFKRTITSSINFSKNITVPFNKQLIYRVFENIYGNALRYTNENDFISFESYNTDTEVIFKIIDSGNGIDEKDLKNIFELFYRGTSSRREEGMGIGLSVVKNIIEIHEWKIEVTSEINKGSCFTITIPYTENN